ncbi:MAG: hypothetical protein DRJ08_02750 [Acidobacteria bacterium]|nr:MAG: hypothetical protein DRJ14_01375 [Acidobacteriota bacterium]RLE23317.1 MAG: hypothetical protein DRJ08_02750 [Acidobacteriota bacterium]
MRRTQLVEMIHANKERMAAAWCQEIRNCEYMKTFHSFRDEELVHRNERVLAHLADSLEAGTSRIETGKFFVIIGKERFREKFPLCEVNYALFLTKKVLWKRMHADGLLASALDLYQALELMNAICDFFDLASFYLIRGYTEEMHHKLVKTGKLTANELREVFSPGSFFYDGTRFDDEFQKIPFFDWHW